MLDQDVIVQERGQKRSRGDCDRESRGVERNCGDQGGSGVGDRDHDRRRDCDDVKKDEDSFERSVERMRATYSSNTSGSFYSARVEMQKPGSTVMVQMSSAWQGDKCNVESDRSAFRVPGKTAASQWRARFRERFG